MALALVTGADGFIGSHLVERLVRGGYDVRALAQYNSRSDWGWLQELPPDVLEATDVRLGDLRDAQSVQTALIGCQVVLHLGALIAIPYSYEAPAEYVATNVLGTLNVLQGARDRGVGLVVHTSTSEVYGTARSVPIGENHPLQGQSPYAASKIGADKLAESYWLSFGLPVVTIRPFNTYGPRQSARAVIPTIITQALTGTTVFLGSLDPVRDLTFVEDTVDGMARAAGAPQAAGSVINLGQGTAVSIGELADRIFNLLGVRREIELDSRRVRPEKSEVMRLVCDNAKARELLGWEPRIPLDEGLSRTIDWLRSHVHHYKPGLYNI